MLDPLAPQPGSSPRQAPDPPRVRPPRKARVAETLTSFSFVNSYSVVDKDANPLITGDLKDIERKEISHAERDEKLLHLDLYDLVIAKRAFEDEGSQIKDLTLDEFVRAFSGLVGSSMKQQLGYLVSLRDHPLLILRRACALASRGAQGLTACPCSARAVYEDRLRLRRARLMGRIAHFRHVSEPQHLHLRARGFAVPPRRDP